MVKELPIAIATFLREELKLITFQQIREDLVTQLDKLHLQSRQILQEELRKDEEKIISTLGKMIAQNPQKNYTPLIRQILEHLPQMIQDLEQVDPNLLD